MLFNFFLSVAPPPPPNDNYPWVMTPMGAVTQHAGTSLLST